MFGNKYTLLSNPYFREIITEIRSYFEINDKYSII